VFQPADPLTARLATGLKDAFDPQGLFNPGRMGRAAQAA
jgi:FAD/FMN-containing dehydrogenase